MKNSVGIAMLGCGVVGSGVLRLLDANSQTLPKRIGAKLELRHIVVQDTSKKRDVSINKQLLGNDPEAAITDPNVDLVIELMGGLEPARSLILQAFDHGKSVVTANKALIAEHGHELVEKAASVKKDLYFEAAVGGGVPIIRILREALAGDQVIGLRGIVNGTSNYMLSQMRAQHIDFDLALKQAQEAGYAEADPALDVGGGDAAHKLAILATMAFAAKVTAKDILTEGIQTIAAIDMQFAERFGYVIKHLAIARLNDEGKIDLRVHPALIAKDSDLASVNGALNAVHIEAKGLGPCMISGYGAGSLPTAVSVMGDTVDVARNVCNNSAGMVPTWGIANDAIEQKALQAMGEHEGCYYLRFSVTDRPGVLAQIAGILGEHNVSIKQIVQEGVASGSSKPVDVVILTHVALEKNLTAALAQVDKLDTILAPSHRIRIVNE
ncbi:MAG: homoserine dehydrogenase [Myxococcales bacterium]|nr:MAG: homoserine dehydrogenase [Myxococcales bacterium]